MKTIKQAKGGGFSLLGFGWGKQTWHSFLEEKLLTAPQERRNILLTLFSVPPSQLCYVSFNTKSSLTWAKGEWRENTLRKLQQTKDMQLHEIIESEKFQCKSPVVLVDEAKG